MDEARNVDEESHSLNVYARFKPLTADCNNNTHDRKKIVLPLHQRLALIRIDKGLNSNKDALAVLKEQGAWFKDRCWDEQESFEADGMNTDQDQAAELLCAGIKMIDCQNNRVVAADTTGLREFEYDAIMKDDVPQKDVYDVSARGLVNDVINGVSCTCLVYGQTGSGKTFTMFGADYIHDDDDPSSFGIVPRACSELMTAIQYRKESLNLNIDCTVSVSFVEIYGSDIIDLLQQGKRCGTNKASACASVLSGNAEVEVSNLNDVMTLLRKGEAAKRKAATAMNARSSRAHSVFIINLTQKCNDNGKTLNSKLFLADLGGSEQVKKSQQHMTAGNLHAAGFIKSDRMREAVNINLGLMSLKACVEALARGGTHVPYHNSQLTKILAPGLGGNSKTSVVVCLSQDDQHSAETINALKFGQCCKQVSNTVRTQSDMLAGLMQDLDREIALCEERIRKNEKWIVKEEKRNDSLAEDGTLEAQGFGGVEVRKTTIMVGAEEDRKLLHSLLVKKSQLSGSPPIEESTYNFGGNVGFGKAHVYGLGKKFTLDEDNKENYRFNEVPTLVPETVILGSKKEPKHYAYMGVSA